MSSFKELTEEFKKDYRRAYRMAVNGHIQSNAACILKLALDKLLTLNNPKIKLTPAILHDSILMQVPADSNMKAIEDLLKDILEFRIKDWIPLEIEIKHGSTWEQV